MATTPIETLRLIYGETSRRLDAVRAEHRSARLALETLSATSAVVLALFIGIAGRNQPDTGQTILAAIGAIPVVVVLGLAAFILAREVAKGFRKRIVPTPSQLPDVRGEPLWLDERTKALELEINALSLFVQSAQFSRSLIELALVVEIVYLTAAVLIAPHV